VLVAAGTALITNRVAQANALADAEVTARRLSQYLIAPLLADVLNGDTERRDELQLRAENRLEDGSLKAIFVWAPSGRVLWCSDPSVIRQSAPPTPEMLAAIDGQVSSEIEDRAEIPFAGESSQPLVEVYVPLRVNGRNLAFETYFSAANIDRNAAALRSQILPLALGALVLLELVQLPVAISLARRGRRHDTEHAELMARSLAASEQERQAIAADLHRGPVLHLAGITSGLDSLRSSVPPDRQPLVDRHIAAVTSAGRSLRRLMVDLYPPGPGGPDLAAALTDLAVPLQEAGIEVSVHTAPLPKLPLETTSAVYRTAKEALTNVLKHASATHVWVSLEPTGDRRAPMVRLQIDDDGVGYPADMLDRRLEGHMGLRLVADRATDGNGTLSLGERPGGGASLVLVLPVDPTR
jgi:signal transduction histidine kinase